MNDTPMPSEGRPVEFADFQRFVATNRYTCPQCGGPVLRDNWPPNYSGGTMTPARTEVQGSIKHVCLPCRIAFKVKWGHHFEKGQAHAHFDIAGITALVERGEHLLTPHDVARFKYFDDYGGWP